MIKGPPPKKVDPNAASNARRLRQAWSIVGCANGVAMVLLAIVFVGYSGYSIEISGSWIVGGAILVMALAGLMIWQMARQTKM